MTKLIGFLLFISGIINGLFPIVPLEWYFNAGVIFIGFVLMSGGNDGKWETMNTI